MVLNAADPELDAERIRGLCPERPREFGVWHEVHEAGRQGLGWKRRQGPS